MIVNSVFDFGQTSSGHALTQQFTLTNPATSTAPPLQIRRVLSAPPFASSTDCLAAVAPGGSCTVTVTYSPSGSAQDVGSLEIDGDATSNPLVVTLVGQPAVASSANAPANLATYSLTNGSLTFAPAVVGFAAPAQAVTVTNTGTVTLHFGTPATTPDFAATTTCETLPAGETCTLSVTSTPASTGSHVAAVEIPSDGATSLQFISLLSVGLANPLELSPTSLSFGAIPVGSTATQIVQATNTGSTPVTFSGFDVTGDFSETNSCPVAPTTLAAGASCTVQVTFAPTAAGDRTASLSVASSASPNPLLVPLTGVGIAPQVTGTPSPLIFAPTAVGSTATLPVTIRNIGTTPVSSLVLSATGDFSVSQPCAQASLNAGSSCQAQISFKPSQAGPRSGSLMIASSDPSSPAMVPLSGTGVAPPGFTLTVDGGSTASVSTPSGQFASYTLSVTPTGGFAGTVALTCAPLQPVAYATCSLLPAQLGLTGGTQTAVATINTITSGNGSALLTQPATAPGDEILVASLVPILLLLRRCRERRHRTLQSLSLTLLAFALCLTGCGGSKPPSHDTPAGTYQFSVTASSTSGAAISQSVNLTLVVTSQ